MHSILQFSYFEYVLQMTGLFFDLLALITISCVTAIPELKIKNYLDRCKKYMYAMIVLKVSMNWPQAPDIVYRLLFFWTKQMKRNVENFKKFKEAKKAISEQTKGVKSIKFGHFIYALFYIYFALSYLFPFLFIHIRDVAEVSNIIFADVFAINPDLKLWISGPIVLTSFYALIHAMSILIRTANVFMVLSLCKAIDWLNSENFTSRAITIGTCVGAVGIICQLLSYNYKQFL